MITCRPSMSEFWSQSAVIQEIRMVRVQELCMDPPYGDSLLQKIYYVLLNIAN